MKICLVFLVLICAGCRQQPFISQQPIPEHHQSAKEWEEQYAKAANKYTVRVYDCISEMYSLDYHPVNSGPICKQACKELHQLDSLVDHSPVFDAEKYRLTSGDSVCAKQTIRKKSAK